MTVDGSERTEKWIRQNGTAFDATQLTDDDKPIYTENAINGFPALSFDGISQFFDYDLSPLFLSDYTIFVVEQRGDSSRNPALGSTVNNNRKIFLEYNVDTNLIIGNNSGGTYNFTVPAFTSPVARIHTLVVDSAVGSKSYYENGSATPDATLGSASQLGTNALNVAIGRNVIQHYKGFIGEIIMYDRGFSDSERQQVVNSYLSPVWKIPLA